MRVGVLPALLALAAMVATSCSDPGEPLPGGYFIFVASDSEMVLNEPKYNGSIVGLGTDLQEIGNHQEWIFGRSGGRRGSKSGYFLLDTKSGVIKAGLAESDWLGLLREAGVPQPPKLVHPKRKSPLKR